MQYGEILGLTPQEILYELVRRNSSFGSNGVSLDKVVIGPTSASIVAGKDSTLTVYPSPGSGLVSPVTVYYNRIRFDSLSVYKDVTQRWPLYVEDTGVIANISELLPLVADTYGIVLRPSDIVDGPIPSNGNNVSVDIIPATSNQAWVGVLPIELIIGSHDLNKLIKKTLLAGLKYPSDIVTLPQGPIVSYGWFVEKGELLLNGVMPIDGHQFVTGDSYGDYLLTLINRYQFGLRKEIIGVGGDDRWVLDDTAAKLQLRGAVVVLDSAKLDALNFRLRSDISRFIVIDLQNAASLGGCITIYEPL